jgi:hypothetical protein
VIGTVLWLVILGAGLAVDVVARRDPTKCATLTQIGAKVSSRGVGRLLLVVLWVFVGVHLFARYTLPR